MIFAQHNLLADAPFTKLDILTCRNLMIYLAPEVHETILARFHFSLNPGGMLVLGSSESVGAASDLFTPVANHSQVYRRTQVPLQAPHVGVALGTPAFVPLVSPSRSSLPMTNQVIANLQSLSDQLLLQRYVPAAVLVNGAGDILHINGKTGRYLEPATGKANWNVLVMARVGLGAAVSEAFHDALRRQVTVTVSATLTADQDPRHVDITAQPLSEPESLRGMVMIIFADVTAPAVGVSADGMERNERQSALLQAAEQALQATREELQATREEMQTSREELTSTNEELQSTNEELTTSAEELRTMNEELVRARGAAETVLARYTDLFESAPVGYFTIDRDGVISQANQAGSRLLGAMGAQKTTGRLALFVIEADRSAFTACVERAFSSGELQLLEVGLWRDQAPPNTVRMSLMAIEDRRLCRVVMDDVNYLRLAEEARRESDELYRQIVQYANEGIWTVDVQARTAFINPKMAQLLGYTPEELLGRYLTDFLVADSDDIARVTRMLFDRDRVQQFDARFRRKNGADLWSQVSISPLYGAGREYTGAMALITDITERLRLEAELRQAQKMEMLGRLSGGIAHDFNNQLAVIRGYGHLAQVLNAGQVHPGPDTLGKYLSMIMSAAGRSATLVRQLLTYSRKGRHLVGQIDVQAVLSETIEVLSRTLDKRIALRQSERIDIPDISGDVDLLQNALLNLAINARDAMPHGGILTFATALVELDHAALARMGSTKSPGRWLEITISDTGHGMSEEVQSHLFEPFFSTKAIGEGTGLGLASVHATIQQHGGEITVESRVNQGTVFRVYLPCSAVEPLHSTVPLEPTAPPAVDVRSRSDNRVLVVEDEEEVAAMISDALSGAGYVVTIKQDGLQALDHYREHWRQIDLILMDMNMPVMAGPECLAGLQQINPKARVLIMSGFSEEGRVDAMIRAGALGFLPKPFQLDELKRYIGLVLTTGLPPSG